MNLETLIINNPSYDPNTKLNISERIFWKWLKEIGGIRYRTATDTESVIGEALAAEEIENFGETVWDMNPFNGLDEKD